LTARPFWRFPLLGSPYAKRPGVRNLLSRPHLNFYRVREAENTVDILRYWHGANASRICVCRNEILTLENLAAFARFWLNTLL